MLIAVALAGAAWAQGVINRGRQARSALAEAPVLPDPRILKPLLLDYEAVVADVYWIRTIQYVGEHILTDRQTPALYPLVRFVTTLDPEFVDAYRIGALLLTFDEADVPKAVKLLEEGRAHNPGRWEFPHDLGRIHYLFLKDNGKALYWWQLAAEYPGSPTYLPRFVARLHAATGEVETALQLWTQLYETAPNEFLREQAREEIKKLLKQLRKT
ncbi:MAG: tetratricopeptide repeat protein [Dehalococcoidia bacterium]